MKEVIDIINVIFQFIHNNFDKMDIKQSKVVSPFFLIYANEKMQKGRTVTRVSCRQKLDHIFPGLFKNEEIKFTFLVLKMNVSFHFELSHHKFAVLR